MLYTGRTQIYVVQICASYRATCVGSPLIRTTKVKFHIWCRMTTWNCGVSQIIVAFISGRLPLCNTCLNEDKHIYCFSSLRSDQTSFLFFLFVFHLVTLKVKNSWELCKILFNSCSHKVVWVTLKEMKSVEMSKETGSAAVWCETDHKLWFTICITKTAQLNCRQQYLPQCGYWEEKCFHLTSSTSALLIVNWMNLLLIQWCLLFWGLVGNIHRPTKISRWYLLL